MANVALDRLMRPRELVLFLLIGVALVYGFYNYLYSPQKLKVGGVKKQVETLQKEKEVLAKHVAEKKAASLPVQKAVVVAAVGKGVKSKILSGEVKTRYKDLLSILSRLMEPDFREDVSIQDLQFQPSVKDKDYTRTDFTVNVRGKFDDIVRYLDRLEHFPALFSLLQVSLQVSTAGGGEGGDLDAVVQARFYELDMGLPGGS